MPPLPPDHPSRAASDATTKALNVHQEHFRVRPHALFISNMDARNLLDAGDMLEAAKRHKSVADQHEFFAGKIATPGAAQGLYDRATPEQKEEAIAAHNTAREAHLDAAIHLLRELRGPIDWRPQETLPEDYFAMSRSGTPVKLAAITPPGSPQPTVTVKLPMPTPVTSGGPKTPRQPQQSQSAKSASSFFILPG